MVKSWSSSSSGSLLLEEQYAFQLHHWELNTNGQHKCCSIGHNHNGHKVKCLKNRGEKRVNTILAFPRIPRSLLCIVFIAKKKKKKKIKSRLQRACRSTPWCYEWSRRKLSTQSDASNTRCTSNGSEGSNKRLIETC